MLLSSSPLNLKSLHHPLYIIHTPSSTLHHPHSIIHSPSSTLHHPHSTPLQHPLSIIHTLSSTLHHPLSIIHTLSPTVHHPLSIIHSPSSTLHHPLSIIHSPSSTLYHPLFIIHSSSSTLHHPLSMKISPLSLQYIFLQFFLLKVSVGCVIVDPSSNQIVAQSSDMRHVRPLNHAVMSCVDAVARSQSCESNNHCPGGTSSFGLFFWPGVFSRHGLFIGT